MKNRSHHTKTGAMWPAHDKLQNRLARVVSVIPLCLKGVFAWSAHRIILLLGLLLTVSAAQAQTSMVKWSFPFSNTPTSNIPVNAGKLVTVAGAAGAMATGGGFTSDPVYSSPNGWNNGAGNSWWLINFSTTNHTGISIKFNLGTYQFGPKDFKMQYSTSSASGPWTDQGFTVGFGVVPSHVMNSYTESLPAACDNKTNVWVRFVTTSATATGGGAVIDEVEILGTSLAVPWYQDTDADGWGNTGVSQTSVTQPSGYVLNSLDCNDGAVHSTTWSNVGSAGISGGSVDNTSIAIDGNGTPYVAFRDMSTSGGVSVMKFSGSSWISVGSAAFSSSYALYPSIAIDKNGTPYVVYRDGGNSDKATVMKYNGSSWVNVGSAGFSDGEANYTTIAIDGNGNPYVAYQDVFTFKEATAKTFNGSSWINVGYHAFTNMGVEYTSIALDGSNTAYVAYRDFANSNKATVRKFDGSIWTPVGSEGFSAGAASYTSLAIDGNNTPYVAFADAGNSNKVTVMKYNGSSWVAVGTAGFSAGAAQYTSISLDRGGTPYVAYVDAANGSKATVMKYNGTSWVAVGTAGFSAGTTDHTSIAVDNKGIPYVANEVGGGVTVMKINPQPLGNPTTPTVSATATSVSSGGNTTLSINTGALNDASGWKWYTGSCGGTLVGSGSSVNVSPTLTTTYYVRGEGSCLAAAGSCGSITISVCSVPTIALGPDPAVCAGATSASLTYNSTSQSPDKYSIVWDAAALTAGFANVTDAALPSSPIALAVPGLAAAGNYPGTFTVKNSGGCISSAIPISVTINPIPTVNSVANQTLCNGGSTTAVAFSGALSSTTYSWANNTTSIGLGSNSAGDITTFTAANNGTAPVTATITVTPTKSGCTGSSKSFTITVDPTPTVTAVASQTLCNGSSTSAIAFSGALTSTTYNWTNNTPSIGLGASSTGDIASFTAANSGTAPVTATITVTPTKSGCIGSSKAFTITANPTPTLNAIANQTLCNGSSTTAVAFSGTLSGAVYNWTNNTPSIGLGANGTGDIAAFTASNSGTAPVTATINVTPTNSGCAGSSKVFTITVNPTPTVNTVANQTLCNGSSTIAVAFSGALSGTAYSWTNNATSIGLGANGTGGIASFTATNTNSVPVTATITVIPSANGCIGAASMFAITVNNYNWYQDNDGDGFGNAAVSQTTCAKPAGYVLNNLDCNDNTAHTTTWTDVGNAGFSAGQVNYTSAVMDVSGTSYVVYSDGANSGKVTVMKYDGNSWANLGSAGFSAGAAEYTAIAIDGSGTPYVVYRDGGNSNKATVMKYNGSSWTTVGSAGFSAGDALFAAIAIDGNGTPYVAYKDLANSGKATVKKYNGSSWVTVGSAAFSAAQADFISMKMDGNGAPYVSYNDWGNGNKLTVMKYNGSNWAAVGSAGFSSGSVDYTSLVLDGSGTPFVSYRDNVAGKAAVMKYNGSSWVPVGTVGFSPFHLDFTSLALDGAGTPYVAFRDNVQAQKVMVMKYNGSSWVPVGSAAFTAGTANYPSMVIDRNGIPHVVFKDGATSSKATMMKMKPQPLGNPTVPTLSATATSIASGNSTTLSINTGSLNDGNLWKWYTGSCGGTLIGTGSSVTVSPTTTTTYYARGEGSCLSSPGSCGSITICVEPTITLGTNPSVCAGTTSASLTYSATTLSPDKYSIVWNATALSAGFTNVTDATLPATPITLTLPGAATAAIYNGTLTVKTIDGCISAGTPVSVTIKPIPTVNTVSNQTLCNGITTTAANFSGAVSGTTYSWTNNTTSIGLAASGTGNIAAFTATNTTSAPVTATITVTPSADGCTGTAKTFTVTVNPTPAVNTVSNQMLCNGATTTAVNFSGTVSSTTYSWTNNTASIGLAASGTGNIAAFTATNATSASVTGTITITSSANACTGTAKTFTITVNPTPVINTVSNQTLCNGAATTAVNFSGAVSGTSYSWTNNTTSIGLAASGAGNIPAFTATNTTSAPVTATITVTPSANGCTGTAKTLTITVNPTPVVNTVSNQTLCNGAATTAVNFSGAVSGTTYSWTNNTTSIGLAASGTGNISAFTATNSTSAPVTATITVTPSANGCAGTAKTFSITVNPTPVVNTVSNQTRCNGATTAAINFSGTVSGTSYSWTNNTTSIGLAASGTGNIAALAATNTTSAPVTATVTVTPSANGCAGTAKTFSITVNPTPVVNTVSNQTRCNGAATAAINFSGAVSGTSYSWTNNTTSIGLAASGTGNIASFTVANSSNIPVTATITVTPSANNCTGVAQSFTITVNPTPFLNSVANQARCHGTNTAAINFGSNVTGTSFSWTNDATSIGLAGTGTGNIASFVATNTTNASVIGTITVTPSANGCSGAQGSFTITANPIPTVDPIASQTQCNGDNTTVISFSGSVVGTNYNWSNNTPSIGLAAAGSGDIAPFAAVNATSVPVTATIDVIPSANSCLGASESFTVTVNPTPMTNTVTDQAICNGSATAAVNFTSAVSGTSYSWTNDNTTIGLAANGTGNISAFTGINTGTGPEIAVITVTPTANGCVGPDSNFTITVNPTPKLTSTLTPAAICNNTQFSYMPTSATVGAAFAWSRAAVSGISNPAATGTNNPLETLGNTTPDPVTVTYVYTLTANGCSHNETVTLVVNPTPKLNSALNHVMCASDQFFYTPTSLTKGVAYAWSRTTVSGITPAGTTGNGSIKETLVNTTGAAINVTYIYTLVANGCSNTEQITLKVNPRPKSPVISVKSPDELCSGTMYQNFGALEDAPAGTVYSWTATNATVWSQADDHKNALISFPYIGTATVTLSTTLSATGCDTSIDYVVEVSKGISQQQPEVIYHNGRFVCLQNNADTYRWGYDEKSTLDSSIIINATNQDYLDHNPDFNNKYYWVMTTKDNCMQKSYYNKPTDVGTAEPIAHVLKLYPNPAHDVVNMELETAVPVQVEFLITDMSGRMLKRVQASNQRAQVDVAAFAQGMYTVSCISDGVKIATVKFVKQ